MCWMTEEIEIIVSTNRIDDHEPQESKENCCVFFWKQILFVQMRISGKLQRTDVLVLRLKYIASQVKLKGLLCLAYVDLQVQEWT